MIDDLPVAPWLVMGAEPEEGLKRGVWIAASVVTKDVLIQVHAIDTEAAAFANL